MSNYHTLHALNLSPSTIHYILYPYESAAIQSPSLPANPPGLFAKLHCLLDGYESKFSTPILRWECVKTCPKKMESTSSYASHVARWLYIYIHIYIYTRIGGFNPHEKYESQIGSSSQLLGKIKHVPNHQPVYIYTTKKRHSNLWSPVFKFDPINPGYQVMREPNAMKPSGYVNSLLLKMAQSQIVDLPINSMGIFHNYVNVYQGVTIFNWSRLLGIPIFNGNFRTLKWRYCTIYI